MAMQHFGAMEWGFIGISWVVIVMLTSWAVRVGWNMARPAGDKSC